MPRAGSSLLQNIFAQRPDFYCTPTSPVLELLVAARSNFTSCIEVHAQDMDLMKQSWKDFCKGACEGFFQQHNKPYVLDKSRGWAIHYDFVKQCIDDHPQIVIMVRDLNSILTSLETKFRSTQHITHSFVDWVSLKNTTTEKRVLHFLSTPPLGIALERMQEIITQGIINNVSVVRYEDLLDRPQEIIKLLSEKWNLPFFEHNFNNIEQKTIENDVFYYPFGDHQIRNKIESRSEQTLGTQIQSFVNEKYYWYQHYFNYV